jgi:hypothetical protein
MAWVAGEDAEALAALVEQVPDPLPRPVVPRQRVDDQRSAGRAAHQGERLAQPWKALGVEAPAQAAVDLDVEHAEALTLDAREARPFLRLAPEARLILFLGGDPEVDHRLRRSDCGFHEDAPSSSTVAWTASATWGARTTALASRSAMVRATLSTRP